jgi:taurine-pyruvate aminotransferase
MKPENINEIVGSDRNHLWHHLVQHKPWQTTDPMVIVEGMGLRVKDQNGREFLDAVSGGVWTVNVGYGREEIADAVRDQIVKMCYFANSAGNIPGAQFAEKLIDKMPGLSRVYYANSGSVRRNVKTSMVLLPRVLSKSLIAWLIVIHAVEILTTACRRRKTWKK